MKRRCRQCGEWFMQPRWDPARHVCDSCVILPCGPPSLNQSPGLPTNAAPHGFHEPEADSTSVTAHFASAEWWRRLADLPNWQQAEILAFPAGVMARQLDLAVAKGMP